MYQPVHQRRAYGPRHCGRRALVEEQHDVLTANAVARYVFHDAAYGIALQSIIPHISLIPLPMPHGGRRWVIVCPCCQGRATRLYGRYTPNDRNARYACRACWGMRYRSQYDGRRPEASEDRISALVTSAGQARRTATYARRMARVVACGDLVDRRVHRYIERRECAYTIALATLLAREVNRENRQWARRILPAVLRCDAQTRRQCADMKDTPAWVKQVLEASLAPQNDAQTHQNQPHCAENDGENVPMCAILEPIELDDLRARYAALGLPRRRAKAA